MAYPTRLAFCSTISHTGKGKQTFTTERTTMHAPLAGTASDKKTGFLFLMGRILLLLLPVTLLLICSIRGTSHSPRLLWLGTLFQLLACGLYLFGRQGRREPTAAAVIMLYVIALSWMLLGTMGADDWFLQLSQAVLLVVPLIYFAVQCLMESGAPAAAAGASSGPSLDASARLAGSAARLPAAAGSEGAARGVAH